MLAHAAGAYATRACRPENGHGNARAWASHGRHACVRARDACSHPSQVEIELASFDQAPDTNGMPMDEQARFSPPRPPCTCCCEFGRARPPIPIGTFTPLCAHRRQMIVHERRKEAGNALFAKGAVHEAVAKCGRLAQPSHRRAWRMARTSQLLARTARVPVRSHVVRSHAPAFTRPFRVSSGGSSPRRRCRRAGTTSVTTCRGGRSGPSKRSLRTSTPCKRCSSRPTSTWPTAI